MVVKDTTTMAIQANNKNKHATIIGIKVKPNINKNGESTTSQAASKNPIITPYKHKACGLTYMPYV